MRSTVLTQVRQDQVRILVHLVWILWTKTCLRCERKFSDTVIELLLRRLRHIARWCLWYRFRCCDFPSYRCSYVIAISTISSMLGCSICCIHLVRILPLFLGGLASSFLPFAYLRKLIDRRMLFGLRAVTMHVFFTYLQRFGRRCSQFVRSQAPQVLFLGCLGIRSSGSRQLRLLLRLLPLRLFTLSGLRR